MSDLYRKLSRIHAGLWGAYKDSEKFVSPVTGREREVFVHAFLEKILPPHFRVGAGVVCDSQGRSTGQLDIVIELPLSMSFPIVGENRLYLADTVGAVIEVKSNLSKQWGEVEKKLLDVRDVARRERRPDEEIVYYDSFQLPVFVVAFCGPKSLDGIYKLIGEPMRMMPPTGTYVVESGLYLDRSDGWTEVDRDPERAAFGFLSRLYSTLRSRQASTPAFDAYQRFLARN